MSRLFVDRDRCIGAGQCVLIAPENFDQDDNGLVVLLAQRGDTLPAAVLEAARACPSGALQLCNHDAPVSPLTINRKDDA